jgi:tetratricopeptide (TPR) repeat protein
MPLQFDPIPEEIKTILEQIKTAEDEEDWAQAIALWDTVSLKHADDYIPHAPSGRGRYVGPYNQATIYAEQLHNLDSAFSRMAFLLANLPGEVIGGYEHNQPGEVRAVVHLARLQAANNATDEVMLDYLDALRAKTASANGRAVIDLEKANVLYRQARGMETSDDRRTRSEAYYVLQTADEMLEAIMTGPPLPWHFFKYAGDFRCSAITTWAALGAANHREEHVLGNLRGREDYYKDVRMIWISRYARGKLHYLLGELEEAQELLQWCVADPEWAPADYPFTFSEMQSMIEPYNYSYWAEEMLKKLTP